MHLKLQKLQKFDFKAENIKAKELEKSWEDINKIQEIVARKSY